MNFIFSSRFNNKEIGLACSEKLLLLLSYTDNYFQQISMQNDHAPLNANPGRSISAYQNEDVNAIAIDSMLANLKILLKKTLLVKKMLKQISEKKEPFLQNQQNQKTSSINEQTKNLALTFDKTIPPDKRMTNLFYMRMIKQIACYQKIIPSFTEIKPKLQQCYSQQINSQQFSILDLYLLCERKFILQIKMVKNKVIQAMKDLASQFVVNQDRLQQSLIQKKGGIIGGKQNTGDQGMDAKNTVDLSYTSGANYNALLKQPQSKPQIKPKTSPKKSYKTLAQAIQNASKSQLYLDFKQRTTQIVQKIYSPLDIQTVEILAYFIPTLMPQDNIDFIYQKVKIRSKKTRKQIREFQTEHALFVLRREENNRRRLRKEESRKRINSFVKDQKPQLKIIQRGSAEIQHDRFKVIQARKCSLPTVQLLKPIVARQNMPQRDRAMSRFRQRFQQSLQHLNKQSPLVLKFNTINPLIVNEQKIMISGKTKKKKVIDQSTISSKQKENSSLNELKPVKKGSSMNKTEKTEAKVSRFGQKRGRSLKNRSNKEIVSKKLKL